MASSLLMASCNIFGPPGSARWFPRPSLDHGFDRPLRITRRLFARSSTTRPEDARIFERYMAEKVRRINEALELAVPLRHPLRIHESMKYSLLGPGKRVAPILCLASCEIVGGDESMAMPTACAIEMVHTMSLIHDDLPCMDDDDLRRGKPANHKAFEEGTALLAGNALLALAFEHMARTEDVPASRVLRAVTELGRAAGSEGIQGGQVTDKLSEGRNDFSVSELECTHTYKASVVRAATACGAIIGGGNEDEIERLQEFGVKLGLLCQVADDVLDVTGSTEELGKKTGRDLAKDKATFVKLMGIEGAKNYAFELLDNVLQELSCFDGKRSAPLRQIASYVTGCLK